MIQLIGAARNIFFQSLEGNLEEKAVIEVVLMLSGPHYKKANGQIVKSHRETECRFHMTATQANELAMELIEYANDAEDAEHRLSDRKAATADC